MTIETVHYRGNVRKLGIDRVSTIVYDCIDFMRNVEPRLTRREFLGVAAAAGGVLAVDKTVAQAAGAVSEIRSGEFIPFEGLSFVDPETARNKPLTVVGVSQNEERVFVPVLTEGPIHPEIVRQRGEVLPPPFAIKGLEIRRYTYDVNLGEKPVESFREISRISGPEFAMLFGPNYKSVKVPNLDVVGIGVAYDPIYRSLPTAEVSKNIAGKTGVVYPGNYPKLFLFPKGVSVPLNPEGKMWNMINESPLGRVVQTLQACVKVLAEEHPRSGGVNLKQALFEFDESSFNELPYIGRRIADYLPGENLSPLAVLRDGGWVTAWVSLRELGLIFPELRKAFQEKGLQIRGNSLPIIHEYAYFDQNRNELETVVFIGPRQPAVTLNEQFGYDQGSSVFEVTLIEGENAFKLGGNGQVDNPLIFNLRRVNGESYDGWLLQINLPKPPNEVPIAIPTGASEVILNFSTVSRYLTVGQGLVRASLPAGK